MIKWTNELRKKTNLLKQTRMRLRNTNKCLVSIIHKIEYGKSNGLDDKTILNMLKVYCSSEQASNAHKIIGVGETLTNTLDTHQLKWQKLLLNTQIGKEKIND